MLDGAAPMSRDARTPGTLRATGSLWAWLALLLGLLVPAAGFAGDVTPRADVRFVPLNPLRGDASPQAGALWGNIRKDTPTGAIIVFKPNFSSPPHIHNITYRGVVIEGVVHNDDPGAEMLWLGPGSFWVQPAGEPHITAAGEDGATIFLEILSGPYLVCPTDEAFDSGDRPLNVDATNLVWLTGSDTTWIETPSEPKAAGPAIAHLWGGSGQREQNGTLLRLPSGFRGELKSANHSINAVVIVGRLALSDMLPRALLKPGAFLQFEQDDPQPLACEGEEACQLYLSTTGPYRLTETAEAMMEEAGGSRP